MAATTSPIAGPSSLANFSALSRISCYNFRSISPSFNGNYFTVEGCVVLKWGESGQIQGVRLKDLTPANELQSGPTEIDLYFEGRWKIACSGIEKNDIVRVSNCSVTKSKADFTEVHPNRLVVDERARFDKNCILVFRKHPQPDAPSSMPVIRHPSQHAYEQVLSVNKNSLDQGVVMQHHIPQGRLPQVMRRVTPSREAPCERHHTYASIGALWNEFIVAGQRPEVRRKVNLYGVVVNARAVSSSRGPDRFSEVVLIDPSSVEHTSNGQPVSLRLFRFHKEPSDSLPFRAVGDIFRAHRVDIAKYIDPKTKMPSLQARSFKFSTFVLWAGEDDSLRPPYASLKECDALDKKPDSGPSHHTITDNDKETIKLLRKWSREYLTQTRSFPGIDARGINDLGVPSPHNIIRTVDDIVDPSFKPSRAQEQFDLVGLYERTAQVDQNSIRFHLTGPQERQFQPRVLVESEATSEDEPGFTSVALSWTLRPPSERSWICIRDPIVVRENSTTKILLRYARHTTTLMWLPKYVPYARYAIHKRPASGQRRARAETIPSPPLLRANGAGQHQNGPEPRPSVVPDPRIVTTHSNKEKNFTPISAIYGIMRKHQGSAAFRVRGRIGGIIEPDDVRLTCRPWCEKCGLYLKAVACPKKGAENGVENGVENGGENDGEGTGSSKQFTCDGCKKTIDSLEHPDVKWAYLVRFVLEGSDAHVLSRAECVIEGKEGDTFFNGVHASNLFSNTNRRRAVAQRLKTLLTRTNEIDCCLMPYTYVSADTRARHLAFKVFGTRMVSEVPA